MTKSETISNLKAYLDGDTAIGNIIPLRSVLESAIKFLEPSLPSNLDEAAEENSKNYYCSCLENHNETGINTDVINYKDKATATEENFDFNLDNDNNDEEIKEKESNKELHLGINSYNEAGKEKKSKIMIASYQPMSYDAYNVFVKIAPSIETMLLNNINKYILQKKDDKQIE